MDKDFKPNADLFGYMAYIKTNFSEAIHQYKIIGRIQSNTYCDVPIKYNSEPYTHDEMEDVILVLHCGLSEDREKIHRVAVKDCVSIKTKNELIAELPCKFGDTIYFIGSNCEPLGCINQELFCQDTCEVYQAIGIHEMIAYQFVLRKNCMWISDSIDLDSPCEIALNIHDFEEKWFLTKEEAEEKLVKLEETGIDSLDKFLEHLKNFREK